MILFYICSGLITVANSAALDRETVERFSVVVIAMTDTTTNVAYDLATVWITLTDINDCRPRFFQERYQSKVWENSVRGTFVAQVSQGGREKNRFMAALLPLVAFR